MAQAFAEYLDGIVQQFSEAFAPASVVARDERAGRSLLEMWGRWGRYRVRLKEVVTSEGTRKYAYYVLDDESVIAGFDNASDPRALRLKYGKERPPLNEQIPHLHRDTKAKLELTPEMTCADFILWLRVNLPLEKEA